MKRNALIAVLLFFVAVSCNTNTDKQPNGVQQPQNETPQVLNADESYGRSSFSKRNSYDIITNLYVEAIEKNPKLEKLNSQISVLTGWKNDSLADYNQYTNTNTQYWASADRLIEQLDDTLLQKSTAAFFEKLQAEYNLTMLEYDEKDSLIRYKSKTLKDQLLLMKLAITYPMIKNYQVNEKPDIGKLQNEIDKHDKLIDETKGYIKFAE